MNRGERYELNRYRLEGATVTNQPKTRSLILRDWEVCAFLDGRKTRITRLVKPQPKQIAGSWEWDECRGLPTASDFPFGVAGDRLVCKEEWLLGWDAEDGILLDYDGDGNEIEEKVFYRSTTDSDFEWYENGEQCLSVPWRSPATMPAWASRLTLEVVEVLVPYQVQKIDGKGAKEEGIKAETDFSRNRLGAYYKFRYSWNADNPKHPWESNPWCWSAMVGVVDVGSDV
jgi:hypothetical protein